MRLPKYLLILCTILLSFSGLAVAQKQSLNVSKGLAGRNVIPRLAVNTDTGDILIVWTNQKVGSSDIVVWSRLLKRKANGKYAPKKQVMVSKATGWNASAQVVYVPWRKQYMVFWDTYKFFDGLVPAKILGRKLNKNGKTVGGVVTVINDNRANNWARAIVTEDRREDGKKAVQTIVLIWSAFPTTTSDNKAGLKYIQIKNNMKTKGAARVIEPISIKPGAASGLSAPRNLSDLEAQFYSTDAQGYWNSFITGYERITNVNNQDVVNGRYSNTWLILPRNGPSTEIIGGYPGEDIGGLQVIPHPTNPGDGVATFGQTRSSLFVRGTFQADFLDDVYSGDLDGYLLIGSGNNVDGSYLPRNYDNCIAEQNADLPIRRTGRPDSPAQNHFAQWNYSDGTNVKSQGFRIKNNGKIVVDKSKQRFNHGGKLTWLEGLGVPGTSSVVLAWSKQHSSTNVEIWMYLYN